MKFLFLLYVNKTDVGCSGGGEMLKENLAGYAVDKDVEVTIGEGDTLLAEFLDKVVLSMKEGERAYIKGRVSSTGNKLTELESDQNALRLNVELKSVSRVAQSCDMSQDERLEWAQHHKEKGAELFQRNSFEFAIKRWQRALQFLKDMEPVDKLPHSFRQKWKELKCLCLLNTSAVFLKQEKWELAIEYASSALEMDCDNVKGLYRRGKALERLNKYQEAKRDFIKAIGIEPDNTTVKSELANIDKLILKEKQMYQRMFAS